MRYYTITVLLQLVVTCCEGLSISSSCLLEEDVESCILRNGMNLQYLTDTSVTCNDKSTPGYYIKRNSRSTEWIIYLEGGLFCYDKTTCDQRILQKLFTSSKFLGSKKIGLGLVSTNKDENPEFWQANHVYVPYCSSDFWIGNTRSDDASTIPFHGSRIVKAVVRELLISDLKDATKLIIAGSSAGGIGVIQNIDQIASLVNVNGKKIDVRGIIDSGWFLDSSDVNKSCDKKICGSNEMFKEGVKLWNGHIHGSCARKFNNQKHKCLFAANTAPLLKTPIFIFQWLLDTVQIMGDNKELELHPALIFTSTKYQTYIPRLRQRMKSSLKRIGRKHGIYAPSCISHTGLASSTVSVTLRSKTFSETLKCWLTDKKLSKCRRRLIDNCNKWTCHETCPSVIHPLTGQEITAPRSQSENISLPQDDAKRYLKFFKDYLTIDQNERDVK